MLVYQRAASIYTEAVRNQNLLEDLDLLEVEFQWFLPGLVKMPKKQLENHHL